MSAQVWMGILLPFLGTGLGAAMVFVLKDRIATQTMGNEKDTCVAEGIHYG